HGNGNVVAARAKGNSNEINGNQIRCYNCRGDGHYASNCSIKPRKRDAAYLQTQLLIAQKEEVEIQLNFEEFDFMVVAGASMIQMDQLSNVISAVSIVEQSRGTVEQHPETVQETRAYFESLYNNLEIEVEKVNSVNHKMKETNADLTTELARYKNQEKCFEISQEKYDKLESCYQKSVYQEQCLTKKINALHLSFAKMITTLNEEIANLNNMLSKEKSTVSSLLEEKKKLKSNFKIHEDELLDKQIQLENKIKELDNILVKTGQSIQTMHMLSLKPESLYYTKQKMAFKIQKIVKDEILPIVNQVDARVQNFKIQILKEAAKFVRNFKSLAKEADESLAKHKALELEIELLLRAVVSQDIMYIVQNNSVVDISNLQTELDLKSTTRTRRPQPRNNPKNDKVPSKSKSSWISNNLEKIEENHRSLQSSSNQKHMSSECNNIKLANQNAKSEVVCAMCKKCLITANHDVCVLNYVNDMNSRALNKKAHVSNVENQKKHRPKVWKPKKVGSKERLASPKTSTPRSCLRWSPTRRLFDLKGKIIASSESVCQSDCSKGDNACTSNPQEPINKWFPNSTFSMTGCQNWFDTLLIPLLSEYKSKDKEIHGDKVMLTYDDRPPPRHSAMDYVHFSV
ncbi:retrovirus-related pol polyprotein from transposon TNT 1-94, partial [Tanacetum coccineum]